MKDFSRGIQRYENSIINILQVCKHTCDACCSHKHKKNISASIISACHRPWELHHIHPPNNSSFVWRAAFRLRVGGDKIMMMKVNILSKSD